MKESGKAVHVADSSCVVKFVVKGQFLDTVMIKVYFANGEATSMTDKRFASLFKVIED